jgi:probable HAF family extracellular repeat protein
MKSMRAQSLYTLALFVASAIPMASNAAQNHQERDGRQVRYSVVNLGTLGGSFAQAEHVNRVGWASGVSALPGDSNMHAVLWVRGRKRDLGTLGGPNSFGFGLNEWGTEVGFAETDTSDPLGENWCGSGLICSATIWRADNKIALLPAGGDNGTAYAINDRGFVAGWSETAMRDPTCQAPQVLQFLATVWDPRGKAHVLPPLQGDSITAAFDIDETGHVVVGTSGYCLTGPVQTTSAVHVVLWRDGNPVNLGSLGGTENNFALRTNERGQVVGTSELSGNATYHAFLWQKRSGMQGLGTLPGDFSSQAFGITNDGLIVGQSCNQGSVTCHAVIWRDGTMTDLNTLVAGHPDLILTLANYVDDSGVIVGQAYNPRSGKAPAFMAIPVRGSQLQPAGTRTPQVGLHKRASEQLTQQPHLGPFGSMSESIFHVFGGPLDGAGPDANPVLSGLHRPPNSLGQLTLYGESPLGCLACAVALSGAAAAPRSAAHALPATSCATMACIYVTNHSRFNLAGDVTAYDVTANGDVSPVALIVGMNTRLAGPQGIAVDASRNIYVANSRGMQSNFGSMAVYAAGANGNVAPIRMISGSKTGLVAPAGIALGGQGATFVVNYDVNSVTVYAASANGNIAPIRMISGSKTLMVHPTGIALDPTVGNTYVTNFDTNGVLVYPPGANGNVAPVQIIAGSNTRLSEPYGVALDASRNVYVANHSGGSQRAGSVTVYAAGAHGNIAPIRTISGSKTLLVGPTGIALDPGGNIYVANGPASTRMAGVVVFAATANGNVAPIRTIGGPKTQMGDIGGIAVR